MLWAGSLVSCHDPSPPPPSTKTPQPLHPALVQANPDPVKVWDDETNLTELVDNVKGIEMDGLVWGAQ